MVVRAVAVCSALVSLAACSAGQGDAAVALGRAPAHVASAGADGPSVVATFRPTVKRVATPARWAGDDPASTTVEFGAVRGLQPGDIVLVGDVAIKLGTELQGDSAASRAGGRRFQRLHPALDEVYASLVFNGRFARTATSPQLGAAALGGGPPAIDDIICAAPATLTLQLPGLRCGWPDGAGAPAGRAAGFALTLRHWDALDPQGAALCRPLPGGTDGVREWECE